MTRTFHDPECGAILRRPLADTESAARAAFLARAMMDHGELPEASMFPELDSREGCAAIDTTQPKKPAAPAQVQRDRSVQPKSEIRAGQLVALVIVCAIGCAVLLVGLVLPRMHAEPIDRPAAASAPASSSTTHLAKDIT